MEPIPQSANELLFGNGARNGARNEARDVRHHQKCDPSPCKTTLAYYLMFIQEWPLEMEVSPEA